VSPAAEGTIEAAPSGVVQVASTAVPPVQVAHAGRQACHLLAVVAVVAVPAVAVAVVVAVAVAVAVAVGDN
jgi:hypothetical protein